MADNRIGVFLSLSVPCAYWTTGSSAAAPHWPAEIARGKTRIKEPISGLFVSIYGCGVSLRERDTECALFDIYTVALALPDV